MSKLIFKKILCEEDSQKFHGESCTECVCGNPNEESWCDVCDGCEVTQHPSGKLTCMDYEIRRTWCEEV